MGNMIRIDDLGPLTPYMALGQTDIVAARLGRNIRNIRLCRGIQRFELARDVGVQPQTITRWEKGIANIPPGRLLQVANILGCSPNDLLTGWTSENNAIRHDLYFLRILQALPAAQRRKVEVALIDMVRALTVC